MSQFRKKQKDPDAESTNPPYPALSLPDKQPGQDGFIRWWHEWKAKTCTKCQAPYMLHCLAIPGESRYIPSGAYPTCSCWPKLRNYASLFYTLSMDKKPSDDCRLRPNKGSRRIGDIDIDLNTGEFTEGDQQEDLSF